MVPPADGKKRKSLDAAESRKQANRDSARRSKQRKKEELKAAAQNFVKVKAEEKRLTQDLLQLETRVAGLQAKHDDLKQQVAELGVKL